MSKAVNKSTAKSTFVASTHEERDERRRTFLKEVAREEFRMLSKGCRKATIARERREKHAFYRLFENYSLVEDKADLQAGTTAKTLAFASAGIALGFGGYVAWRHVSRYLRTADSIRENAEVTAAASRRIAVTCDQIVNTIKSVFDAIKSAIGSWYYVPAAVLVWWILYKFSGSMVLTTALVAALATVVPPDFARYISEFFSPVMSQSGASEHSSLFTTSNLVKFVVTCVSLIGLPTKLAPCVAEVIRRTISLDRLSDTIEGIVKDVLIIVEQVLNKLCDYMSWSKFDFADKSALKIKKMISEIAACEAQLSADHVSVQDVVKAYSKVQGTYEIIKNLKGSGYHAALLQRALDRLEAKMLPHMGVLSAAKNYRVEPEFIGIYGSPGQGKTEVVTMMSAFIQIMAGLAKGSEVMQNTYCHSNAKHFNGYAGQPGYVIDDLFAEKYNPSSEQNVCARLIQWISNFLAPLEMADVHSKGKYGWTSKFIIATTNARNLATTPANLVLMDVSALERRLHNWVHFRAAPGYRRPNPKHPDDVSNFFLDWQKLKLEHAARLDRLTSTSTVADVISAYPWEAFEVQDWDFTHGSPTSDWYSLRDFMERMAEKIKLKGEMFNKTSGLVVDHAIKLEEAFARAQQPATAQVGLGPDYDSRLHPSVNALYAKAVEVGPNDGLDFISKLASDPTLNSLYEACFPDATVPLAEVLLQPELLKKIVHSIGPDRDDMPDEVRYVRDQLLTLLQYYSEADEYASETNTLLDNVLRWTDKVMMYGAMALGGYVLTCASVKLCMTLIRGACDMVSSLISTLSNMVFGTVEEQSNVKEIQKKKIEVPAQPSQGRKTFKEAVPQTFDGSQWVGMHDRVYRNTYKLFLSSKVTAKPECIGQVMFVHGRVGVMPEHFLEVFQERFAQDPSAVLRMYSHSGGSPRTIPLCDICDVSKYKRLSLEQSDVAFVSFPRGLICEQRSMLKYFLPETKFANIIGQYQAVELHINETTLDAEGKATCSQKVHHDQKGVRFISSLNVSNKAYEVSDVLEVDMPTKAGDCGAPLMLTNVNTYNNKFLLGFHFAGKSSIFSMKAYTMPLSEEIVTEAVKRLCPYVVRDESQDDLGYRAGVEDMNQEDVAKLQAEGFLGGSFQAYGKLSKPVHFSTSSKIQRSVFHDTQLFGPCPKRPAILHKACGVDGVLREPMVEGLRNYQTPVRSCALSSDELAHIVDIATKPFRDATVECQRHVLSFEHAVSPPEQFKLKPINRKTSPGWPYCEDKGVGKTAFFGANDDFDFSSEKVHEIRVRVDYIIDQAREGVRLAHICRDFLKDEVRPHAKVDKVMTRVISGSPLDYVIAFRMFFGAYMAAQFQVHTLTGLCPGINPYTDWDLLVRALGHRRKDKTFDGDFKAFDSSEQPDVHWAILDHINEWYGDGADNARVRTVLWCDLVNSRHLVGPAGDCKYVVEWQKSLPSGHPMTTHVNSLYSLITLTACYDHCVRDGSKIWDHAGVAVYGDDNIVSVDDFVCDKFNFLTVRDAMRELFGLDYTPGRKDGSSVPYQPLEECTFLKRGFRFEASKWQAPLELSSCLYPCYWVKGNASVDRADRAMLTSKLEGTLGELSLHHQGVWDEYYPAIKDALANFGVAPLYVSRQAYAVEVRRRKDFWW